MGIGHYFRQKASNRIHAKRNKRERYAKEYRKAHGLDDKRRSINHAKDFNFAKDTLPTHGSKKTKRRFF